MGGISLEQKIWQWANKLRRVKQLIDLCVMSMLIEILVSIKNENKINYFEVYGKWIETWKEDET
jgi:hypothetical protein